MFESVQPPPSEPGRFRAVLKLFALGVLVLLLLIPVSQLLGLVRERSSRRNEVREELARVWGGEQTLGAVVLAVPYSVPAGSNVVATETWQSGTRVLTVPSVGWTYFLPGAVQWHGKLAPEKKHRGLFEVTQYEARLTAGGWFARPDPAALGVKPEQVDWSHALVLLPVTDRRGLQERPVLRWAGHERSFAPGLTALDSFGSNLQAALVAGDLDGDRIPFSLDLVVRGSTALHLLPLGDDTTADLQSPWPHPSFVGAPSPNHQTTRSGFAAHWSMPYFGRGFPQRWRSDELEAQRLGAQLEQSTFGVALVQPADPYQQTERAVKYAVLFILLTFTTVFVLELLSPVRLHPMQYLLVGAALCLFYLLLLALAEHVGMVRAYAAAAGATAGLVTLYTRAVLAGWARALAVGTVLAILYGWLYTVLRAEDYALLLGAIGLFVTLAAVMFLTRRLDWSTLRFRQPAVG